METIYWGECEESGEKSVLLVPIVHQPTGVVMYIWAKYKQQYEEALVKGQVPAKLGDKLTKYYEDIASAV